MQSGLVKACFAIIIILAFLSCNRSEIGGEVIMLTDELKGKFPEMYFELDSVTMIYKDSVTQDTFLLTGGPVEKYIIVGREGCCPESPLNNYETYKKRFESQDKKSFLELIMSSFDNDGYPGKGLVIKLAAMPKNAVSTTGSWIPIRNSEIVDTTADQQLVISDWKRPTYNVTYNIVTGVKSIECSDSNLSFKFTFL